MMMAIIKSRHKRLRQQYKLRSHPAYSAVLACAAYFHALSAQQAAAAAAWPFRAVLVTGDNGLRLKVAHDAA